MIKKLLTILLILPLFATGQNFFWSHRPPTQSTKINYVDNGGLVTTGNDTTTINVPYPSTSNGDVLILVYWQKQDDIFGSLSDPSGWTQIGTLDSNNDIVAGCWVKIADGTESGTEAVQHNFNPHNGQAGIIYRYNNKSSALSPSNTSITRFSGNASSYSNNSLTAGNTGFVIVAVNGNYTITKLSGEYTLDNNSKTADNGGWSVVIGSCEGTSSIEEFVTSWGTIKENVQIAFNLTD